MDWTIEETGAGSNAGVAGDLVELGEISLRHVGWTPRRQGHSMWGEIVVMVYIVWS